MTDAKILERDTRAAAANIAADLLGPVSGARRDGHVTDLMLDVTTLGLILDRLRQARMDLQQAHLHAAGHAQATRLISEAGRPLRNALDVFEAAYVRGRL